MRARIAALDNEVVRLVCALQGVPRMNEDRVVGTARKVGGKVQEGLGRVTGDTTAEAEGIINQAAGAVQEFTAR